MTATLRRKSLSVEFKAADDGSFRATLATFGVVDHDGDVTDPKAFPIGKEILISAYQHGSWSGALPVGKGVIGADDKKAWVDGQFFTDTTAGLDTYRTVKHLGPMQQWSYGYDTLESSTDKADLEPWPGAKQILRKLDVYEGSPVLLGAGINTGTDFVKSVSVSVAGAAPLRALALVSRLKAMEPDAETLATIAQIDAMADDLDELVDGLMDQLGIPDPDEVAEGEPEEAAKSYSFGDHATHALAGVTAFVSRGKSLADLRAKKHQKEGRVLSSTNRERLAALADGLNGALTDIQDLLVATEPADAGKASGDAELESIWLGLQRAQLSRS